MLDTSIKSYEDDYNGINIIFCKNTEEQYSFMESMNNLYPERSHIIFKTKSLNNKKTILVEKPKKLKYKNCMIFMDMSSYKKQNNGLSINNIKKFKTPVFIFSKNNKISKKDIKTTCKRLIISSLVLQKSSITIDNYNSNDLINLTNNFSSWIVYDNYKHSIFSLEIYKNYHNTDDKIFTQDKKVFKLKEENYIEYYLDNPITFEFNITEPQVFF